MKRNSIDLQTNPSIVHTLMQEFEREGLRMSKRISKSNQGSTAGTPLSTTPPQSFFHQYQQQHQSHSQSSSGIHSPLSMSSSLIAPQTSPWILGYALDDMSRSDEIAVLPSTLVPLHPFVDSNSFALLLHYFKPLITKTTIHIGHIRSPSTTGQQSHTTTPHQFSTEKLGIMLTRSLISFSQKHNLLERLQLNREQLVWIIYLMAEHFYNRHDNMAGLSELNIPQDPISTPTSPLSLSLNDNNINITINNYSNSSHLYKKTYYEVLNSLLPLQSPFTNDDNFSSILKPIEHYNDISHAFIDISNALAHLLDWIMEFLGLPNTSTLSPLSSSNLTPRQRAKQQQQQQHNEELQQPFSISINHDLTTELQKLLKRAYNLVKVGAVVPINFANGIRFNGFLPIPHHLLFSIVHRSSNNTDPYSNSMNWFDIACKSTTLKSLSANTSTTTYNNNNYNPGIGDLVAVLKRRLFRDAPINLGDVEIITSQDFLGRRKIELSEDLDADYDINFDLIPSEDLVLFYGYTLDDYDYLSIRIPVYKTAEQLEVEFSDRDEQARESLLQAAKLKILQELGINIHNFKQPGVYVEMITRDKPLGINLLEVTRVAKLREFEAYFYEPGQCSRQITYRNELEVLVYLSQLLNRILDGIILLMKRMFLNVVSSESNMQLPTELEKYYKNHQSIIERSLQQISHAKNHLCRLANKTCAHVRPTDAVYRKFERWLVDGGVQCPKLQIANFQDGTGRGLVTTKKVDENEVVVNVPRKFLINVQVAREHPILGHIFEEFSGLNDDTILFLFVIYEKENPNSFWRPFFDTLPSYFPTSIHYTSTELLELEGTNLFAETLQVKEHLQSIRDLLFPELSEQYPNIFPESLFSWENFLWARSLFDSRAIQLKIDDKITNCLVPMADMINHHYNAQISQRYFDQDDQCFKMVSCCSVPASSQIFLHYGALQNWELAIYYGFVIQDNPYDSLHIGFELPDEDTPETTVKKQELLQLNLLTIDTHYLRKRNIPPKVMAALRVALMTPEECNPHVDIWNPISRRNEEAMLHTLYSMILMLLKQFPSSWEEDKQLCEQIQSQSSTGLLASISKPEKSADDDDPEEDDEEEHEEQQSSEQMKIVLQYRIEQKQILTSTLEQIIEKMTEMGIEIPKSPEEYSDIEEGDLDDYDDEESEDDDDEYFSDKE